MYYETSIYLAVISDANNGLNILYQRTVDHSFIHSLKLYKIADKTLLSNVNRKNGR